MGKDSNNEKSIIKASQSGLVRVSKSITITNKILKESKKRIGEPIYQTININGLEWMLDRLKVKRFRNGDLLTEANSVMSWKHCHENKIPAYCYYDGLQENESLGLIYKQFAFTDGRDIVPEGFRIPFYNEFGRYGLNEKIESLDKVNGFRNGIHCNYSFVKDYMLTPYPTGRFRDVNEGNEKKQLKMTIINLKK